MNPELKIEQGSQEWFRVRSTRITASQVSCVMARPDKKKYNSYLQQLVRANAAGIIPDEDVRPWHTWGMETEPIAAAAYQWDIQKTVSECGVWLHPENPEIMSASPDRIVKDWDSGVEIKSRSSWKKHEQVMKAGKCPPEHKGQIQMQILVCGFKFVDYVDYYRQKPEHVARDGEVRKDHMWIFRVEPDKEFLVKMLEKVYDFWEKVQEGVRTHVRDKRHF